MRRKEEQLNAAFKKEDQTLALETTDNKKKTQKKAPVVKGLKKGNKDQAKDEPQKTQEEIEAEKKKIEMEHRKKAEEERKEELKPKDYTKEEMEAYAKFVEEVNNIFAEIHLRQMNVDEEEGENQEQLKEGEEQV